MNKALLPAIRIKHELLTLMFKEVAKKPELNVVWERVVTVDYQSTAVKTLLPVIRLIDNDDLVKVKPIKYGAQTVKLSLVDLWEDKMSSYPSIDEAFKTFASFGKEVAGLGELALFTRVVKKEKSLSNWKYLYVLALREYNRVNSKTRAFPSMSRDHEQCINLGLTYDWMAEKHHFLFLVIG